MIVKNLNKSLIDLRNSWFENPKKSSRYCWKNPRLKILIKILTPKQILQKLTKALHK